LMRYLVMVMILSRRPENGANNHAVQATDMP
jgi:hypothetical protein